MSRLLRRVLTAFVLVIGVIAYLVWSNPVFRNLPWAISYERTLDRYAQTDETVTEITATRDASGRAAELVGALFGRDDDLPYSFGLVACTGAGGKDGMPILFSHEIDHTTLEPGDITITKASGERGDITCLTMAPADDAGELRTALLLGQFGGPEDQPVLIEITGNVLSKDHQVNFKGATIEPVALELGPSLVWAEIVPQAEWTLGKTASRLPWGGGDGCPQNTRQIVRVAWNGGVTPIEDTAELSPDLYQVTVITADGSRNKVAPFAIADQGDGDNNHKLCLDVTDPATSVLFPAHQVTDPRGDVNDETYIDIVRTNSGHTPD